MTEAAPHTNDPHKASRRHRILSLDGGGIRGVFALEILEQMESLLRVHSGNPQLVLADHFDFIGGTSTGAIIATFLAWGEPVARVKEMYAERSKEMFQRSPFKEILKGRYQEEGLAKFLMGFFAEDNQTPAKLGSRKLRTLLMVVLRNATKGSAWPLTNNRDAKYNQHELLDDGTDNPDSNLNIPLWQVIRGSTAAPFFFPPETIKIGKGKPFQFVDGGLTPHNNPSVMAFLQATQPCYRLNWPTGADKLLLVSVGNGRIRSKINPRLRTRLPILRHLAGVAPGLIEGMALHQDMLCRIMGRCLHGESIDSEVGDLLYSDLHNTKTGPDLFTYLRYDKLLSPGLIHQVEKSLRTRFRMDKLQLMPFLQEQGKEYALENVVVEHLL